MIIEVSFSGLGMFFATIGMFASFGMIVYYMTRNRPAREIEAFFIGGLLWSVFVACALAFVVHLATLLL